MSQSILRKGKSDNSEMDKEQVQNEPFVKIGTIWSETEGPFENIKIKEENISDLELENSPNEDSADQPPNEKPEPERKSLEKEVGQTKNDEEKIKQLNATETNTKCLHTQKNFKICKKRLRCCDCRATLCPECHCTIYTSVQTHFSKSDNNGSFYACKLCSMIFKSNCALQAHVRIHLLDTPYVCPDCGAVYSNIYFLSLHLINKCYHVYKVISNGCKFCLSRNMSPAEFVTHFEDTHITPVFKCSQCLTIFQTAADFSRHLAVSHKKQNVTCLSYYSCRVCGNLVISKNLYAKHIKFHQEHTAAFQIGFLCSCGQSFNTATTFRCHFKLCSKKGILPPQWTYLQVTLKTQEIMNVHGGVQKLSFGKKKDTPTGGNSLDYVTESTKVQKKSDYNIFDAESSDDLETNGSNSNDSDLMKGQNNNDDDRKESEQNTVEKNEIDADKNEVKCIGAETEESKARGGENENCSKAPGTDKDRQENITETPIGCNETVAAKIPNVQPVEECPAQLDIPEKLVETTEKTEGTGDKNLKVLYDHIPCDHLGYLKTRKLSELQDITLRKTLMDGVTCESDTDKFLITSVLDEKTGLMRTKKVLIPKNQVVQTDDITYLNGLENVQAMCSITCRDVQKQRSTSFFSCPFCTVLFPKHLSTFQRFRLHIECYHPDASLDITVDRTQTPKSQIKYTSITPSDDCESADDICDLDDVDLQTRLNQSLKKEKKETESISKENSDSDKKKTSYKWEKRDLDTKCKKKCSEVPERQECTSGKNSFSTKIHDSRIVLRSALIQEVTRMKDQEKICSLESSVDQERGLKRDECEISIECPPVKKPKSLLRKQVSILNHKSRRASEDSLSDERSLDTVIYPNESEEQGKNVSKSDSLEGSEVDGGDYEDSKDENRGRLTERRNSKRESDVWSEFYKTLKIAETFKKAKMKNQEAAEESSILTNYTNKRIVKKPKRYRESSDSEDSNDDEKGSIGDSKNFENRLEIDEDDPYVKKRKLLDRLENVDYRILDYLLKLVDRKQKNVSLLKKNVEIKGFKKKLANGVKLPKQKNEDDDNGENVGEFSEQGEDIEWELAVPVDEKIRDRRRGRPRKTDPMLLKDRRSSEVVKVFEADEGDFFTSRRKRKMSKFQYKKVQSEKNDFSSGQVITTKISESEKKLTCAVCKECYQTETEFRQHIQVHRMDENNHQCMECGECFVVRPSLEKHLHAFHKIKDVHKYIEENECSTPERPEEAELEPLKENQCKVCRDQFDNPHDLNKHFRIHGMAFLRQFKKSS